MTPRAWHPSRWPALLTAPVDPLALAAFRVVFGLAMVGWVLKHLHPDLLWSQYVAPRFYFTYPGFDWVQPWSPKAMYTHFYVMGAAALGVALGLFFRLSIILFFVSYSYVFLLDKTPYNNHYWLIILVSGLLILMDAACVLSVDALLWRRRNVRVPQWNLTLLKAQVLLVYFFGGVAKLNADWLLHGLPLRLWLAARADWPVVGPWFSEAWLAQGMSIAGMVFDLSIAPLVLWRRSRGVALVLICGFHTTNQMLFSIGVFHALMLFGSVLFVEPETLRRALRRVLPQADTPSPPLRTWLPAPAVTALVAGYLGIQAVLPFQHLMYPGSMAWTEEGRFFAWQSKARDKAVKGRLSMQDGPEGQPQDVDVERHLSPLQVQQMYRRPDMLWQYAQFLAADRRKVGWQDPIIHAHVEASLNGRPFAPLINPEVNLAAVRDPLWRHAPWILPMPQTDPPAPLAELTRAGDGVKRGVP